MEIWQLCTGLGIIFLILEMIIPSMFFLNFSLGAFVVAVCTLYISDITALIIIFVGVSLLSLLILRPILVKKTTKSQETGIAAKYVNKVAKAVETINHEKGVISIYDERWEARSDEEIEAGKEVIIEKNDSLIMYVKEKK